MPTHRPRTLDQLYGTGITPDEAPHVERTVDGEDYSVDVDLTPAATTLLEALAEAVNDLDAAAFQDWAVLVHNREFTGERRDLAVRELLTNRAVRQALTIRLTPETADDFAYALNDAAWQPDQCDQYDQGDRCTHYAAEGETQCPRHLPPNPQP